MILGIGVDICSVKEMADSISTLGDRFLQQYCVETELAFVLAARNSCQAAAQIIAGKEAIVKAFGTGFTPELWWTDITLRDQNGRLVVAFSEDAKLMLDERQLSLGDLIINLSTSACRDYGLALAVVQVEPG